MTVRSRAGFLGRRDGARAIVPAAVVPADPRTVLSGPLDPTLLTLRGALASHRRRLWLRRIVRRSWIALAVLAIAEAALWTVARFVPFEAAPIIGLAMPVVVAVGLLVAAVSARPSIGETALAVDAEGGLGDRVSSALELAVGFPASATPAEGLDLGDVTGTRRDDAAETDPDWGKVYEDG